MRVAVEHQIGVGEVVDDVDVVLARDLDDVVEEVEFHALRGRVAREIEQQHLRLRPRVADCVRELGEEVDARPDRHVADVGAGDHEAVGMDRVGRVRHQHDVAVVDRRQREVGEALLGTDGDDRLRVRVDRDVVARLVPVADRAPQARDALRHRVAMRVAPLRGLHQLVDDVLRRGLVRIAHAEIDDVLAPAPGSGLQLAGDVEYIGREPLDPGELMHGRGVSRLATRRAETH